MKILEFNNNLYQAGLLRLLTQSDYNTLNTKINNNYNTLNNNISTKTQIATGSYAGNGSGNRIINIGFYPKAVLIMCEGLQTYRSDGRHVFGGLALQNNPVYIPLSDTKVITITSNGFKVSESSNVSVNDADSNYYYIAFKWLPNGNKIINHDSNLYFNNNLLRLLTQNDLTEINNSIDNVINTEIPQQINNSIIYGTRSTNDTSTPIKINIGTPYRYVIIVAYPGAGSLLVTGIFSANDSFKTFTGGMIGSSNYARLNIESIKSTSFTVRYHIHRDKNEYRSVPISYIAFI